MVAAENVGVHLDRHARFRRDAVGFVGHRERVDGVDVVAGRVSERVVRVAVGGPRQGARGDGDGVVYHLEGDVSLDAKRLLGDRFAARFVVDVDGRLVRRRAEVGVREVERRRAARERPPDSISGFTTRWSPGRTTTFRFSRSMVSPPSWWSTMYWSVVSLWWS